MNVFENIYQQNAWSGHESRSGPGSGTAATERVIPWIKMLVQQQAILSILDIGCGDGFWLPDLTVRYTGVDVSATAVTIAKERHPDREYICGDASRIALPQAELVIIRDVIQHLSWADAHRLLDNVRASGSFYLLASTYPGSRNVNIDTGDAYSPDLQAEPFDFPVPELLIFDGHYYHQHDTRLVRDSQKFLGWWPLR